MVPAVAEVPAIQGTCDARFAGVRDAFARNFAEHGEVGAAVAVALGGHPVVDLWAGWRDRARTRPWERDTLVNVFSVGKAVAAVALLRFVERGTIDLDAPVARYWPEFAAAGKDRVTVRMVLSHRAGLPAIRTLLAPNAMYDWNLMTAALAAEEPWWEPGRRHGYHVNTFGFLVGELVRRASGMSIGACVRRELTGPLALDFHFGIGAEHDTRIAEYLFPEGELRVEHLLARPASPTSEDEARWTLIHRVYMNPPGVSGFGTVNTRAWRAAEMPSTNGHANARAVARFYAVLAAGGAHDGGHVLMPATLDHAAAEASSGPDAVTGRASRFGLGFQLAAAEQPFGPNPRTFGHFGAGGSAGFADPDTRLAFAYTMNLPGPRSRNPRPRGLIDAVYAAL